MRSPLQSGIRWDLPPLPNCPPLIDEERDSDHRLRQNGLGLPGQARMTFSLDLHAAPEDLDASACVQSIKSAAQAQDRRPEPDEEARKIEAYLAGIKDHAPLTAPWYRPLGGKRR